MVRFINLNDFLGDIDKDFRAYEKEIDKIFQWYANEAVLYFIAVQTSAPAESKGAFWTNHTFRAAKAFYTNVFKVDKEFIALEFTYKKDVDYVKYLEHDHDERFAALPAMLAKFAPMIMKDIRSLFGDG